MKSKTASHAERELQILVDSAKDPDNRPIAEPFIPEMLALIEKFGRSGQSGASAPYTAQVISSVVKKLCLHETICPLQGTDDEWNDCGHFSDEQKEHYQNNRRTAVFKDGKDGKPYFIEAIVFKDQNDSCFTGGGVAVPSGGVIGSRQYIKGFPFEPKTFYIDVISTRWADKEEKIQDDNGDWWTHVLKDETQLKEVFEYYDRTNGKCE